MSAILRRLSAFTRDPAAGNPAGVWIGDELPDRQEMQRIAAEVGYSETAFLAPMQGLRRTVRYYSPLAEVTFCGHATIASGVVLGERDGEGTYVLETAAGEVPVRVTRDEDGMLLAALTSVAPRHEPVPEAVLSEALAAMELERDELDEGIGPARIFAGAWHLLVPLRSRQRLARLRYDFPRLQKAMLDDDLTTVQVVWFEAGAFEVAHSRNPFPVGGVVEDPATGASAAALGGYLRDTGRIQTPARFQIRQGEDMGRPSLLRVEVPAEGGVTVAGTAVEIPAG
ncbi:MAG: PhzF family phenazine biosynthesis protein [Acidobacteria bacterium]|nr:MAG: PhzF family phenazine biosynthesis protein [Acidobacteriota bacterium]REK03579.1 MAG: PhzF family phenazine biosynthesis protein [Acidobacteriota bacterium]